MQASTAVLPYTGKSMIKDSSKTKALKYKYFAAWCNLITN